MIGVSRLICGESEASDKLRFVGRSGFKPVVVWNCTSRCNLFCRHCYSSSSAAKAEPELTTDEAKLMIDDLAEFGCPVLLFSGGEPLMRGDLFELVRFATERGMRAVLSTNGTLITSESAAELSEAGIAYVGVSLDGLEEKNDLFRGRDGAFGAALNGIECARRAGIKVGLRFTITSFNADQIPGIFDLMEGYGIPRICFYHLVYSGRAKDLQDSALGRDEARRWIGYIFERTESLCGEVVGLEVLTVDNHADAPFLYLWLKNRDSDRARVALDMLRVNAGNASGEKIACIDWKGDVHPDQFWHHYTLGNIGERRFSEIWSDGAEPLLSKLRNRREHIHGRCAECKWFDLCNANLRVRAEAAGDLWGPDPACYLTDEEISDG